MSGAREVGINHPPRKIGAIPCHAIEMIPVGQRVEFRDQSEVLLERRINDKNVNAPNHRGSDHLSPFCLVACSARIALAIIRQVFRAISLLENMLDLERAKKGPISWILHAIQVHAKRNDIPFEWLIFTEGCVIADD
jgi:hypothetical protein